MCWWELDSDWVCMKWNWQYDVLVCEEPRTVIRVSAHPDYIKLSIVTHHIMTSLSNGGLANIVQVADVAVGESSLESAWKTQNESVKRQKLLQRFKTMYCSCNKEPKRSHKVTKCYPKVMKNSRQPIWSWMQTQCWWGVVHVLEPRGRDCSAQTCVWYPSTGNMSIEKYIYWNWTGKPLTWNVSEVYYTRRTSAICCMSFGSHRYCPLTSKHDRWGRWGKVWTHWQHDKRLLKLRI